MALADEYAGLRAWAIEGTGGHGAGLTRRLNAGQELVIELDRPQRTKRRNGAKSDPLDAIRAAREALARRKLGTPRSTGERQALSVLLAAPEALRGKFRGQKLPEVVRRAAGPRIQTAWSLETAATATVVRDLARRSLELADEAARHERDILAIVRSWHPELLAQQGVGAIVAATVLCAWSHPGRIRSDASFAMLAGVAPIPANSGQVTTHFRLNRYGDRQLNRAIHTVVLSRVRYDEETKAYIKRRTAEGKTPREIKRCLKRYVARDLFRLLEHGPQMA